MSQSQLGDLITQVVRAQHSPQGVLFAKLPRRPLAKAEPRPPHGDVEGVHVVHLEDRRGRQKQLTYAGSRAMVVYDLPLNEVVFDFYDRLKSVTRGYASFDYEMVGYEEGELVKVSILVNAEPVDALSIIVHKSQAEHRGRALCERLKDLIPRQLFKIAIQAAVERALREAQEDLRIAIDGGFMTVTEEGVIILVESASFDTEIDAEQAKSEAESEDPVIAAHGRARLRAIGQLG